MKAVVVYKSVSEHARPVEEFLRDFMRRTGKELETLDPESREGISFCGAYDLMEYPSVVAMSDDGHALSVWKGLPLPTINEVSYYV